MCVHLGLYNPLSKTDRLQDELKTTFCSHAAELRIPVFQSTKKTCDISLLSSHGWMERWVRLFLFIIVSFLKVVEKYSKSPSQKQFAYLLLCSYL